MGLSSSASVQRAIYAKRCCVTVVPVSRSFKVIEIDTIRKLACDFLFAFRSNDMAVTLAVSTHETCVCLISNATERSQKDYAVMQLRLRGFLIVRETVKEMQYCS